MAHEVVCRKKFQRFKEASSVFEDDANGGAEPFTPLYDFSLFREVNPGLTSIPGLITPEELAAVIGSFDRRPSEEELREMIGEIDANRDGIREFVEFFNRMTSKVKEAEDTEEELKEAFKVFDKDQNGFISPNELRQVMINLGEKLTDEEVEQMIKEADLDGDGLVNYDDFFHLMTTLI